MSASRQSLLLVLPGCLLILLPFLAVNFGAHQVIERQTANQRLRQHLEAERILESFAEHWSFPTQLSLAGAEFRSRLGEVFLEPMTRSTRISLINGIARQLFFRPFPAHQLVLFEFDPEAPERPPAALLETRETSTSKRSFSLAMKHLVQNVVGATESPSEAKIGQKMVTALFGEQCQSAILYSSRRGYPTPVVHRRRQHLLFWDFATDADGKPRVGFFLLVPIGPEATGAGFRLALQNSGSPHPIGFVRFHASPYGHVLPNTWKHHPGFRSWLKRFLRRETLVSMERKPSGLLQYPLSTGNLFVKLIPECTHLGVTVLPPLPASPGRTALLLFNLVSGLLVLLVVLRGFFLEQWPRIGLQTRFTLLFVLAAAFPFISVAIIAGLYLQEKREALLLSLQRELQTELISIDLGKDRIQAQMRNAFHKTVQNREFLMVLERDGISNPRLLEIGQSCFRELGDAVPLPFLGLYDYRGNGFTRDGTFVSGGKSELVSFFRSGLVCALWRALAGKLPPEGIPPNPLKQEEQMLLDVFEGAAASTISNLFSEYRNQITHLTMGRESLSKLHEFFPVRGIDRYAIMALWRNTDFADLILKDTLQGFLAKFPDGSFMAYRRNRGTITSQLPESRSHQALREAILARGTFRQSFSAHDEARARLMMVLASRRNPDEIFAAEVDTGFIQRELSGVIAVFFQAFLTWLITTAGLLLFTVQRIVTPLRRMTHALQSVSAGNLNLSLKLARGDELGQLSDAFDGMIAGMKKRKRLSTVVSQKARDDLFTGASDQSPIRTSYRTEAVTMVSDIRSFTTICEGRSVREVTSLLNRHFETMAAVIVAHHGRIDKFIGDAIQAIFEETDRAASKSAAHRAAQAGIAMLSALEEINRSRIAEGYFPYSIGIGLAKGEVLIGGFGDRVLRFDYSVMGEPMNRAARLENLSKKVPYYPLVLCPQMYQEVMAALPGLHPLPGHEAEAFVFPFRGVAPATPAPESTP